MSSKICPKLLESSKDQEYNLSTIFNVAAGNRKEYREMFEDTHTIVKLFDNSGHEILEEEIFLNFDVNYKGNKVIVIEGETGTGKSEICVKLVYMLEDNDWEVIHIHKNMDLPTMLIELLKFYEKISGKTQQKKSSIKEMRNILIDVNKRTAIAKQIVGEFFDKIILREEISNDITDEINNFEELFSKKIGNIIRDQQITDYQAQFFTINDLKSSNCLLKIIDILANLKNNSKKTTSNDNQLIIDYINNRLWKLLIEYFDTPTIEELMSLISEEMKKKEKRVAMVIEDLKIATLDLRYLLRYMERDEATDRWDYLIAGTTDIIDIVKEEATRRDRFTFYRTNKKDKTNVLFLSEDNAVDFASRYLKFLHKKYGKTCEKCDKCDLYEMQLYFPFNKAFLSNLFKRIDDKKPRTFVMKMYYAMQHVVKFNEVTTNANEIKKLPKPYLKLEKEIIDENISRFISYYSDFIEIGKKKVYRINKSYFHIFQIDLANIPDSIIEKDDLLLPVKASNNSIAFSNEELKKSASEIISEEEQESFTFEDIKYKIERVLEQISAWKEAKQHQLDNDFLKINSYFKIGIKELIRILTDNFSLDGTSNFIYKYGENEYPIIHINENFDDFILLNYRLNPLKISELLLRNIITLGFILDEKILKISEEKKLEICSEGLSLFLNIILFWRSEFNELFNEQIINLNKLASSTQKDNIKYVLSIFVYSLLQLTIPIKKINTKEIMEFLIDKAKREEYLDKIADNCKCFDINSRELIDKIKLSFNNLFDLYSKVISDNANFILFDDINTNKNFRDSDCINKISKNNIKKLDNHIFFNNVMLSEILLPIKEAYYEISKLKKRDFFNKKEFIKIYGNLKQKNIEESLKIIDLNQKNINSLDPIPRNKISQLSSIFRSGLITDILFLLENIEQIIIFQLDKESDIIPFEEKFNLDLYLGWKWLLEHNIKNLIDFFTDEIPKENENEINNIIRNIQNSIEDINYVISEFNK